MEHYIDMMLRDPPQEMDGTSNTPAAARLFKTNLEDPKIIRRGEKKDFRPLSDAGLISKSAWSARYLHGNCLFVWSVTKPRRRRLQEVNTVDMISTWFEGIDPHIACQQRWHRSVVD